MTRGIGAETAWWDRVEDAVASVPLLTTPDQRLRAQKLDRQEIRRLKRESGQPDPGQPPKGGSAK